MFDFGHAPPNPRPLVAFDFWSSFLAYADSPLIDSTSKFVGEPKQSPLLNLRQQWAEFYVRFCPTLFDLNLRYKLLSTDALLL